MRVGWPGRTSLQPPMAGPSLPSSEIAEEVVHEVAALVAQGLVSVTPTPPGSGMRSRMAIVHRPVPSTQRPPPCANRRTCGSRATSAWRRRRHPLCRLAESAWMCLGCPPPPSPSTPSHVPTVHVGWLQAASPPTWTNAWAGGGLGRAGDLMRRGRGGAGCSGSRPMVFCVH